MLWQMQSALFSVRCFSLDVAGLSPCTVNVISHQKRSQGLRERLWRLFVELNGNQALNIGEDWLFCMTHWQLEEI